MPKRRRYAGDPSKPARPEHLMTPMPRPRFFPALLNYAVCAVLTGACAPTALGDGLLAAWEFNTGDVNGSDVAATAGSAANTTGQLQADAAIVGGVLSLDGAGDYLQFGDDLTDLRQPDATLTIAAWVQTNSPVSALRRIVEHEDNTYFWAQDNIFQYTTHGTGGGATGRALSTTAPTVGEWQHVLVTFAPNQPARIYIDGVLEGSSSNAGGQSPIPNNTHTFQIGARRNGSGSASNFWDGLIDDVGIWDCELPLITIESLAGAGAGGYPGRVSPAGLGEDCNGDGIPDTWYLAYELDPCEATVGDDDPDDDTLTTFEEFGLGTNPTEADTDGDGLDDQDEVNSHNTDPTTADSDGDGLDDGAEVNVHGSDPNEADSDGDGLRDGAEINDHETDPTMADSDADGVDDDVEVAAGSDPNDPASKPSLEVTNGLYLYYSFDSDAIAGDTVNDQAGHPGGPFEGERTNGGPDTGLDGVIAEAVEFGGGGNNGDHHFLDLAPHANAASNLSAGSIAAWVKPDTSGLATDVLTIMAISNADIGTGEMRFWISNGGAFGTGTLAYQTRGGPRDASIISDGVDLFDGDWHHVAVTVDPARTATLYVDGVPNTSGGIGFLDIPGANSMSVGRNKDVTPGGGQWFFDGLMDDLGVWDRPLNAAEVAFIHSEGQAGRSALARPVTGPGLDVQAAGDNLIFTWDSQDGKLYNLRSETDPAAGEPASWPIFDGHEDIAANAPLNTLTVPRPSEPFRLFVIEEFNAPPTAIFTETFDAAADLPAGWTTGANSPPDAGSTAWEVGAPTTVGPPSAHSPPNAAATNLDSSYGADSDTDIFLITPSIDLTNAASATLRYYRFIDIETMFDAGRVRILDASDDSEIALLEDAIEGTSTDWESVANSLPAAALGKMIKIEFRLDTDDFGEDFAGFYLDDVEVTVP